MHSSIPTIPLYNIPGPLVVVFASRAVTFAAASEKDPGRRRGAPSLLLFASAAQPFRRHPLDGCDHEADTSAAARVAAHSFIFSFGGRIRTEQGPPSRRAAKGIFCDH
jgi:hypothetical protein